MKSADNFFDIVAACYFTIMQYQSTNETAFIAEFDDWSKDTSKCEFQKSLKCFQGLLTELIYRVHPDSDAHLEFDEFLCRMYDCLENVVDFDEIDDTSYISLLSYIMIDVIDLYLQDKDRDDLCLYPDHCPLNTTVFVDKCSVYYCEKESILGQAYALDKFRKPLHNYTIGTSFKCILMFENTRLNGSVPKIQPVFISNACKQRLKENHFLRIASIPFIGFDTFNVFEQKNNRLVTSSESPKGQFYIGYREQDELANIEYVTNLLSLAIQNEANIVVFPEYIMSTNMLSAVKEHLAKQTDDKNDSQLILVLAGTNYEYNGKGRGNNILHIYNSAGYELGCYYKYSPFNTLSNQQVHGASLDNNNSLQNECMSGQRFTNLEILSDPGKECTLLDVEGIGRILPAICRDVIDGVYTDNLANLFMPSLVLVSSWSKSISGFRSRLTNLANTILSSSLLCNCCNAVESSKQDIGMFIYPHKEGSEMKAEEVTVKRTEECMNLCRSLCGCIHLVDFNFENGALSVSIKQINSCTTKE